MAKIEDKICPVCDKEFRSKHKTCSETCGRSLTYWGGKQKPVLPIRICLICSKEYQTKHKACSVRCGRLLVLKKSGYSNEDIISKCKECDNLCVNTQCCSRKCRAKFGVRTRGRTPLESITYTCKMCDKLITKKKLRNKDCTYEFCGRKCANKHQSNIGAGIGTDQKRYEYWIKNFGIDIAKQKLHDLQQKRIERVIKRWTGVPKSEEQKRKISDSVRNCGYVHPWTDKTYDEIFGPEDALRRGQHQSKKLLEGYKNGSITPKGSTLRSHPQMTTYGFKVRSKIELQFVHRLEELGLIWNQDWFYERKEDRVPYWDPVDQKQRTYFPDFNVRGEIVEIKQGSKKELNDPIVVAKASAASKIFEHYSIVIRRKIKKWLPNFLLKTI